MRNVLAYKLSNEMGRYASGTRYCELYINEDYKGVYVFMEKVKIGKTRSEILTKSLCRSVSELLVKLK